MFWGRNRQYSKKPDNHGLSGPNQLFFKYFPFPHYYSRVALFRWDGAGRVGKLSFVPLHCGTTAKRYRRETPLCAWAELRGTSGMVADIDPLGRDLIDGDQTQTGPDSGGFILEMDLEPFAGAKVVLESLKGVF